MPVNDDVVVSLFFLGTSQHRETKSAKGEPLDNILTQFAKEAPKDGSHFVHVFDGPGSKSPDPQTKHFMPGLYYYLPDPDPFKPGEGQKILKNAPYSLENAVFVKAAKKLNELFQKISGNLYGDGVDDNLLEAYLYIEQLIKCGKKPKVVNLYGHSRGADTTERLPNILAKIYPDIEFNIFGTEPVSGLGRKGQPIATLLNENINDCQFVLTKHVDGFLFEAQDLRRVKIKDPTRTRVNYHIYYGNHTSPIKFRDPNNSRELITDHTAMLTWGAMYNFAVEHGTLLPNSPVPKCTRNSRSNAKITHETFPFPEKYKDDVGRLLLFEQMKDNEWFYAKKYPVKVKRDLINRLEDYVDDSHIFVCQEHRELFKRILPYTFDYIFQRGREFKKNKYEAKKELEELADKCPMLNELEFTELYNLIEQSLINAGATDDKGHFKWPDRSIGQDKIEQCPIFNKKTVVDKNSELSRLTFAVKQALNHALLNKFDERLTNPIIKHAANLDAVKKISAKLRETVNKIARDSVNSEPEKCALIKQAAITACDQLRKCGDKRISSYLEGIIGNNIVYGTRLKTILQNHLKRLNAKNASSINFESEKSSLKSSINDVETILASKAIHTESSRQTIDQTLVSVKTQFTNWKTLQPEKKEDHARIVKDLRKLERVYKRKPNLCDLITKDLKAYIRSNKLSASIQEVMLAFFGAGVIKDTQQLSKKKREIARDTIKALDELKIAKNTNNFVEINKILDQALANVRSSLISADEKERTFEQTIRKWQNEISVFCCEKEPDDNDGEQPLSGMHE